MTDWTPRATTGVFVAERVVIWNIIEGSLCMRRKSCSTNTFLFFITRWSERMAIGTYESQKNVATAMNRLSNNTKPKVLLFNNGHILEAVYANFRNELEVQKNVT